MAKASKIYKIGESAVGGRIKVDVGGKVVRIKALEWNSDKVISSATILSTDRNSEAKIMDYLEDLTSYFFAERITKWIKTKIILK